jgi:hypothetical protein
MTIRCIVFCIDRGHHRKRKEYGEEHHHRELKENREEHHHRGHRDHREKIKSFLIIFIRNISKHTDNNEINILF